MSESQHEMLVLSTDRPQSLRFATWSRPIGTEQVRSQHFPDAAPARRLPYVKGTTHERG